MIDRRSELGPGGGSTLRHYLRTLRRRKWLVLLPLVLIPLVVFLASHRQAAVYEASADVLVNRQEIAATSLIGQTPALDDAGRSMDTQAHLARVSTVATRTLEAAGLPTRPIHDLLSHSAVYPLADILRFTVDDADSALASRIAGEYARQFVRYRRELDTAGLARTRTELAAKLASLESAGKTGSALYARLADRQQQLDSLVALSRSNVTVVKTPSPGDTEQVAPRPLRNTALAVVAGLVVGLVLAFLAEALSTRPRSEDELEALLGLPVLGRLRLAGRPAAPPLLADPGGAGADAFHALRTSLELANSSARARLIMVTGLGAAEGTSQTSANLAIAIARSGRHVVLVDLDLRESALTRLFGLESEVGVTSVVRAGVGPTEALVPIPLDDVVDRGAQSGPGSRGALLHVVAAGPRAAHPAELLSSNALATFLAELAESAEIVLVEAPPLLEAPDAAALSGLVEGLLVVVSSSDARKPKLADARRAIEAWPLAKLGCVIVEPERVRPSLHALQVRRQQAPQQARKRIAEADVK